MKIEHIALLGNPNVGKTSLFNALTGLNQKVGNFPGVTVEKKTGACRLSDQVQAQLIDLPGLYSLFAKSPDERVVSEILLDPQHPDFPDLIIVVLDASNIERSLLLYTQVLDLGFEVLPVLNLLDVAAQQGQGIAVEALQQNLSQQVIALNARSSDGIEALRQAILSYTPLGNAPAPAFRTQLQDALLAPPTPAQTDTQLADTLQRMNRLPQLLDRVILPLPRPAKPKTDALDRLFIHPVLGYLIYFGILLLLFQLIFSVADYPMTWIEDGFNGLSSWLKHRLPEGALADLLTDGLIAGIGGVVIFIPQIALLFGIIAILEETGYMSRVVFLMDRPMRLFGLSGKSIVPLLSGAACAVPAIMSARNIDSWKERLITIFVTPFISCSARLPVFVILIALIIPPTTVWGFNLQGLTLLGLYALGIVMALLTALLLSLVLRQTQRSVFVMDMPQYKAPRWKNVGMVIYQKTKTFVLEAGKIILAISILLWGLASYGPPQAMQAAEAKAQALAQQNPDADYEQLLAAQRLEASYIGHLGHWIEPAIRPLGYDWKIGIALITSFAAREVFVGTLGTIYSVGEEDEAVEERLIEKMRKETFTDTGKPVYTLASGMSLLLFYVFAMQCMSTLAIVYRETNSRKWTVLQLFYMTALAYLSAFLAFHLLS